MMEQNLHKIFGGLKPPTPDAPEAYVNKLTFKIYSSQHCSAEHVQVE